MMSVPNILTISRVILLPLFFYLYQQASPVVSAILLASLLVTDFLDGYLARRLRQETPLGALLDPIADKLVALILYGYLWMHGLIPTWFATVILLRNFSQTMSVPILVWWLNRSFHVKPKAFPKWVTAMGFIYVFIPFYAVQEHALIMAINPFLQGALAVAELQILMTYLPRLVAIALKRHDTFE